MIYEATEGWMVELDRPTATMVWGGYPTLEDAQAALRRVKHAFGTEHHPVVVPRPTAVAPRLPGFDEG